MPKTETPPVPDTAAPPRNFTLSIEDRLRAYAQGVPGYIRRRRRIEDLVARLRLLPEREIDLLGRAAELMEVAEVALLNDLIAKHNRYYPIEANLAIDVKTRRLIERGAPWRPLPTVSIADLAARAAAR